jgi:tRNA/rRNA methyltransferase
MPLRIVLIGTKDSANVGSAARAMKNFGLSQLWLAEPRCRLDDRAFALASHAADVLENAVITDSAKEALVDCTFVVGTTARARASERNVVLEPRAAMKRLPPQGAALMFGPEDTGLTNQHLDLCQAFVTIPTSEYASVNLAQAVNILAYEWFSLQRQPETVTPAAAPAGSRTRPAPRQELERMYAQLLELLHYIGYTDPHRAAGVEHIFRRLFDRAEPSENETAALRGIWRQARWAADQEPEQLPGRRSADPGDSG